MWSWPDFVVSLSGFLLIQETKSSEAKTLLGHWYLGNSLKAVTYKLVPYETVPQLKQSTWADRATVAERTLILNIIIYQFLHMACLLLWGPIVGWLVLDLCLFYIFIWPMQVNNIIVCLLSICYWPVNSQNQPEHWGGPRFHAPWT